MRLPLHSLLIVYALANAVLYSMLLPLWEGFDEPFHFAYVQSLANGAGFPDPRTSTLSREVASSLLLAPASLAVQHNLPSVTSYPEYFAWSESKRERVHEQLAAIEPSLRWQNSDILDYEALQAPLSYLLLTPAERAFAKLPLPHRVLLLRIVAGAAGSLLLLYGAEFLARQLRLGSAQTYGLVLCALSSQMIWATLAHVANDWLAVPLALWFLIALIRYDERPSPRRGVLATLALAAGLLTKAYFLAFVPVLMLVFASRHRWRDLATNLLILAALAGPWYLRNVERYGTVSGMQELREGTDPTAALQHIRIIDIPAVVEAACRSALWTGNNTFRSFSVSTLRIVIAVWAIGLILWVFTRPRRPERIVLLFAGVFVLALAYDAAINYVASRGETASPCAWYSQLLLVPMLALAFVGAGRSRKLGKAISLALIILFGYVLVATYWAKLIPIYAGIEARASLPSLLRLYRLQFPTLITTLSDICLAPGAAILLMAILVSLLAFGELIIAALIYVAKKDF